MSGCTGRLVTLFQSMTTSVAVKFGCIYYLGQMIQVDTGKEHCIALPSRKPLILSLKKIRLL